MKYIKKVKDQVITSLRQFEIFDRTLNVIAIIGGLVIGFALRQ